jgi:hypothetical protein
MRGGGLPSFCPIDLGSGNKARIKKALSTLLINESVGPYVDIATKFLFQDKLLDSLRQLQLLDSKGILNYNANEELDYDFLTAMTCRDCTLFVEVLDKVPLEIAITLNDFVSIVENGVTFYVRAKLTDLDVKRPSERKRDYWTDLETKLQPYYNSSELDGPSCFSLAVPDST